jgi:uncharacterized membrane protein YecN with MAPEG domain
MEPDVIPTPDLIPDAANAAQALADVYVPGADWLTLLIYPSLITILALGLYFVVTVNVGRARRKFKVPAPQTTGNPDFERFFRVQQNTLEQLVGFLPALWLASLYVSIKVASALGLVWIAGRLLYANGYYRAAEKRGRGFVISVVASGLLMILALVGVVSRLAIGY